MSQLPQRTQSAQITELPKMTLSVPMNQLPRMTQPAQITELPQIT